MYNNSNKRPRRPVNTAGIEQPRQKSAAEYNNWEDSQQYAFTAGTARHRTGTNERSSGNNERRRAQYVAGNQPGRPRSASRFPARSKAPREESHIYFIALLPTAEVGKEIIRLKQEFARHYTARHALKVLPHITMQVPFTTTPAMEKNICAELLNFAASQAPFEIQLNGFGTFSFDDRRVLYIQVEKDNAIMQLHRQMIGFLRREFGFSSMLARHGFTPHISVAFNDLSASELPAAWNEYQHKPFKASFRVNNLYLLRHSGTSWQVLQKCRLGS